MLVLLFWLIGLTPHASANVIGTGTQNFNTITSGLDFVTVQSSETLKPGIFNLGLFFNNAINSLPYFENVNQSRTTFNNSLLGMEFNMGVGILPNWDAGISFPYVVAQSVDTSGPFHGQFTTTGSTEVRLNTKYRLWGDDSHGFAMVLTMNNNRVIDNPYTGENSGPTWNLEAVYDLTINDKVRLGFNLGHRWAQPGTPIPGSPIEPIRNQVIASVAANYLIPHSDTKVIAEIFGGWPVSTVDSNLDRSSSSLELLAGVKHDLSQSLAAHVGMGTELVYGISSPAWRIYAGLNYAFGPVWHGGPEGLIRADADHFLTRDVKFEFDSDQMIDSGAAALDEFAKYLGTVGHYEKVVVEGHTDSLGREKYNLDLSVRRAKAVREYLIQHHKIKPDKIEAEGYGAARPIADNGNFQGRQLNRRVEFRILK